MRQPALFLGHGSPMTAITDNPARAGFSALGQQLARPRAILCISAHYETHGATHVTEQLKPPTIHDFRGFPPDLHAVQYPASGSAELVRRAVELGGGQILPSAEWGFDHGVWGVLMPVYPDADVPVVAMSLDRALDAEGHLALATRLTPLREEGVMIVGSGNVIHNLSKWQEWSRGMPPEMTAFGERIVNAVTAGDLDALTRFAPDDRAAALAINSAEHYLPLLYVAGARLPGDDVRVFNHDAPEGIAMASFLIGHTASA